MTPTASPNRAAARDPHPRPAHQSDVLAPTPSAALVWIDARDATVVRWHGPGAAVQRLLSEVPAHHHATGNVRQAAPGCPGGGAQPRAAGEQHRVEHLTRFIAEVVERIPPDDDVLILGAGTVREQLTRRLVESDRHHGRSRSVRGEASGRLTERQLVARVRILAGVEPRRRDTSHRRRVVTRSMPPPPEVELPEEFEPGE